MTALWGGRFKNSLDDAFSRFNQSLRFDCRLLSEDILASKAFILGLADIEVVSKEEQSQLYEALDTIEKEASDNPDKIHQAIASGVEDVHSYIEQALFDQVGDLAYKANTGRSRNEQVATSTRLWLRKAINNIQHLITQLQYSLCHQAQQTLDKTLIGYTHLQRAQPTTWAHYFLCFNDMLSRDWQRLNQTQARVNICPLGCGALVGNSWGIDRQLMADYLQFDGLSSNSLDSTSDRDYIIDFISASALLACHLSRLAEDLIIYSSAEFNIVELSDSVTTGSSLMPQKKNPDSLELIRGKTGRVFGHLTTMLTVMKSLPSCYNKDLQEDKEALFDTVDTVTDCLLVAKTVVDSITVKSPKNPEHGYITATEIADYLSKKGLPFRQAHHMVGQIVQYAIQNNKNLLAISLTEYQQFSSLFGEDIYDRLTIESAINAKCSYGGTAVDSVSQALKQAYESLKCQEPG